MIEGEGRTDDPESEHVMSNRKCLGYAWRIIGLLLVATAPITTWAAEQPVQEVVASEADRDELVCRTVDRPGSHMKQRVCAAAAEWSAARGRLILLRNNGAAGIGPAGDGNISTAGTGFSFQR
jgi:hypothetical protein